jgi:hypothetical protein
MRDVFGFIAGFDPAIHQFEDRFLVGGCRAGITTRCSWGFAWA